LSPRLNRHLINEMKTNIRYYVTIPIIALLGLFQSAVFSDIRLFDVSPDLVFVVVITWVLVRDQPEGLLAAVVGGGVVASLSGGPRMLIFLLFVGCSILIGYAHRHLPRMAGIIPYLSIIAATLLYKGTLIFWLQTTTRRVYVPGLVIQNIIPEVLLNLLLVVVTYHLGTWADKKLGPPTVDWQ